MEKVLKAIYDKSKEKNVDIMVAAAMVREDGTDTNEAEKYIKEHYNALCAYYGDTAFNGFDKAQFEEYESNLK